MSSDYRNLKMEKDGAVWRITIHRPGDRNSIDSVLMAELSAALKEAEDSAAGAVVFRGSGEEYFIGGADGIEMMRCTPAQAEAFSRRIQGLFERMEASPLILLAAIDGLCFGGGFEFALACDLRVAAESARIGLPEVKVGIIPGGGGTQRLPRLVGLGQATEMILSGRLYSGKEAARMGLVNRTVPDGELRDEAERMLEPILRHPRHALGHAKAALKAGQGLASGLAAESAEFGKCFDHDYFVTLMKKQLKSGLLVTTAQLPDGFLD